LLPEFVEIVTMYQYLSDTDIDIHNVQIGHENTSKSDDFGEIDIFVYKFEWILRIYM